jgi:hypothetical protein
MIGADGLPSGHRHQYIRAQPAVYPHIFLIAWFEGNFFDDIDLKRPNAFLFC